MRKKIVISLLVIILLFQYIIPTKVNAFTERREIISVPAKIEKALNDDIESEMTGLNRATGKMLQPTVKFFTFFLDAIMSIFTNVMTQENFHMLMVDKEDLPEELEESEDLPETGATFIIEDIKPYKTATGKLKVKYPYFTFSTEDIFAGNIDLLNVNFIEVSNEDDDWLAIRKVVAQWYMVFRMIAIVGLLSVLIYTGIKMILSATASDKAKYKEMMVNWFVAVILAFSIHYIMLFILNVVEEIMNLMESIASVIEVKLTDEGSFKTNLIGLARFQLQNQHFTAKIGFLVIYTALIVYTFKFTFVYLKRVLRMAFLTLIAPIVALTYPLDKANDGKAQGFEMWFKDFLYNALLQPMHYILYYILVTTSLSLAANNPIYGIVALKFVSEGERLLKSIFGFGKASGGTVQGIAGAFATGAVVSTLNNVVRDPLHPFGGGNSNGGGSGESGTSESTSDSKPSEIESVNVDNYEGFLDDYNIEDFIDGLRLGNPQNLTTGGSGEENPQNPTGDPNLPKDSQNPIVDDFIKRYRQGISEEELKQLQGQLHFDDGYGTMEELLKQILQLREQLKDPNLSNERRAQLQGDLDKCQIALQNRIDANESIFKDGIIPPQYSDNDIRSNKDIMEEMIRLWRDAQSTNNTTKKSFYNTTAQELMNRVNRRMLENQYIAGKGGPQALLEQDRRKTNKTEGDVGNKDKNKNTTGNKNENGKPVQGNNKPANPTNKPTNELPEDGENKGEGFIDNIRNTPVGRGVENVVKEVGKDILKPVWNLEKNAEENLGNLVENIAKTAAGLTLGVAAAAVQAGISITDGEYSPAEGIATVGAGFAGGSKLVQMASTQLDKKDVETLKKYSNQWYNSDDIINKYNKEYHEKGKKMRQRAVKNYVSRGITNFEEQKKAIKFAEQLKKERNISEDEADWIAAGTIRYRQNLVNSGNYNIIYDLKKREKYMESVVDSYTGSKNKDVIKRTHEDFIANVRDFDRANS